MTGAMWLRNLVAFAVQAGVLVLAGALLARLFRIREPRASLAYWRTLLVVCLLLPLCQPWQTVTAPATEAVTTAPVAGASIENATPARVPSAERAAISLERVVLIVLAGGLAARGAWLVLGAWVLGRIRREATPLDPLPEAITRAQERVGVSAAMCVSTRVAGPLTFGLLRPVVVFPPGVTAMEGSVQHAIACHELLHVRRRDWVFQVIEESVRTIFWFHPAIWWLVGHIQLTREQVVDQAAVRLMDSRERYVEALLAVAIAKSPGILTPAPAFLRRSLLKKRVAQILQESTMTTRRLILAMGASAGALVLAAALVVRSFPLEAQGQPQTSSGKAVAIVKGGEHLLHGELPEYPRRAIQQHVEGDVTLDLAVDDRGEVSDARVLNGPDELRKVALEAVLGWHYAPSSIRSASTQATLRFNLAAANSLEAANTVYRGAGYLTETKGVAYTTDVKGVTYTTGMKEEKGELTNAQRLERMMVELQQAMQDPNLSASQRDEYKQKAVEVKQKMEHIRAETEVVDGREKREFVVSEIGVIGAAYTGPRRLVAFRTERVSADAAGEVMKRSGLKIGDTMTEDAMKKLREAATAVDEHFRLNIYDDGHGGVTVALVSD